MFDIYFYCLIFLTLVKGEENILKNDERIILDNEKLSDITSGNGNLSTLKFETDLLEKIPTSTYSDVSNLAVSSTITNNDLTTTTLASEILQSNLLETTIAMPASNYVYTTTIYSTKTSSVLKNLTVTNETSIKYIDDSTTIIPISTILFRKKINDTTNLLNNTNVSTTTTVVINRRMMKFINNERGEILTIVAFIIGIITLIVFIIITCLIISKFVHRNEVNQNPNKNMMTLDEFNE